MIALLMVAALLSDRAAGPAAVEGRATYYSPGVMERVAANRGLELRGADAFVALNDCRHLGRMVWLQHGADVLAGRVADCAQAQHRARREALGYVAEVDHQTALRWNMRGPVAVTVHFRDPRRVSCETLNADYRCY